MPIGIGSGLWAVVLPVEKQNLCLNPSFEFGTQNWGTSTSGTIGTSSNFQQFGAWSCSLQPTTNTTDGIRGGIGSMGPNDYGVSAYIRGANGVTYNLEIAPFPTGAALGSTTVVGNGQWQYVAFQYTEASPGSIARAVVIRKRNSADVTPFYVDGVQVEVGSVTTYFDGDQPGGTWTGAQQQSVSYRSGQYRSGGSVIALADIGLQVDQMIGVGVAPVENSSQSYAVTDGAQFQRTRVATRKFTLTAKPIVGTSLADFHITRRTLYDALKPDLVSQQQPVRLLYYGAQGTQQIDAYYEKGLELGNMDGIIAENAAISFSAYDPYWYAPIQQGTTLPARTALGSVNFIAKRTPMGQWGTLGNAGTTFGWSFGASGIRVQAIMANSAGTVFIGGIFGTVGGTFGPMIAQYNPITNRFGTLQGGTLSNSAGGVFALAQNPNGTVFFGGQFTNIAGTNNNHIGQWTGAFGTLIGGTVSPTSGFINALLFSPLGTLFLGGQFGTLSGTANAGNVGQWQGAYGTFGGSVGASVEGVNCLAWGLDNQTLFIGGNYGNVGGTRGTSIGFFKNGAFGTMGNVQISGVGGGIINAMQVGPSGQLYETGFFNAISGNTLNEVAVWNGVQHQPLGNGFDSLGHSMAIDPLTGNILVGGSFTQAGSIKTATNYALWNGAAWLLPDISVSSASMGTVWVMAFGPDNTLYIGGDFLGTAYCASISTIVNTGRAAVYPVVRYRNLSASGTARLYQLVNYPTGAGIWFNYTMLPGEQAFLNLQPGSRSFQSSARGNIFGVIIPGSNLATFSLLPGTNYISFFSDQDSLETSIFWQPKGWSVDSGTIF